MQRFLAWVCVCCPLCMARRKWPQSRCAVWTKKIERLCPFCRAYDRLHQSQRVKPE